LDAIGGRGSKLLADLVPKDEKVFRALVQGVFEAKGIRRVRIIEPVELVVPTKQGPYKGFKPDGNAYLEILEAEDGKQWVENIITIFVANSRRAKTDYSLEESNSPRLVMRLFNRDMIEFEHLGSRKIYFIQKMSKGMIAFAEHFEANADQRNRDKEEPFKFTYKSVESLRKSKVRFLVVTPAGRIRYLSDAPDDSQSA
jgi:CRISPR-associated endonuclease Csn1